MQNSSQRFKEFCSLSSFVNSPKANFVKLLGWFTIALDIFKFLSNDLKFTNLNQGKLDNKAKKLLPVLAKLQAKYLTLNGDEQDKVSSSSIY